jgi:serine/threonine-protein kinase
VPDWVGRTLSKVYIEKLISRGGMAEVYIGRHTTLNRLVAVKILHSYLSDDPSLNERFRAEAQGVAMLRHPNIVQVFDFDITEDQPYIIMEALDGPTLAEYLRVMHAAGGRMPLHIIARFTSAVASALDYAHTRGIVHRDIKPANIVLRSEGGRPVPRPPKPLPDDVAPVLTDFGLARIVNSPLISNSGTITGTPAYMSPEQARSDKIGSYSDIYSLGVILYELLAGHPPFKGDTPARLIFEHISQQPPSIRRVRDDLPEAVEAVVMKALAKNPDERYEAAGDLAAALAEALHQSLILGPTPGAPGERTRYPMPGGVTVLAADTPRPASGAAGREGAVARPRRARPGLALAALVAGSLIVGAFGLALISGEANRFLGMSVAQNQPQNTTAATDLPTLAPTDTAAPTHTAAAGGATPAQAPSPSAVASVPASPTTAPTLEPTATPTPLPTPSRPFLDDFGQPLGDAWTVVRGNIGQALGRVTLRDLAQGQVNEGLALISDGQWRDVSVEGEIKNVAASDLERFLGPGNAAIALLIRAAPDGSGLGLVIERTAIQFALLDRAGNWKLLAGTRASQGLIFDAGRVVRVEAVGNLFTAYVAGEKASTVEYRGSPQGQVGAWFRSVLVTGLTGQVVPQIENIDVRPLPPPASRSPRTDLPEEFGDDFERGLRPEWALLSGGWGMARERLTLIELSPTEMSTGLIAVTGPEWSQASVEAIISDLTSFSDEVFLFEGNSAVALLARLQPDGSGMGVVAERRALTLALRDAAGRWTPMPDARVTGFDFDQPHHVELVASGSTYTVYLDSVQVLSIVYEGAPAGGTVGVWMRSAIPINPSERTAVPKVDDFRASGQP